MQTEGLYLLLKYLSVIQLEKENNKKIKPDLDILHNVTYLWTTEMKLSKSFKP